MKSKTGKVIYKSGPMGFAYFVAWIGAIAYFVGRSVGFWGFVLAVLKACVWPAYVLYHVLVLLHA